LSLRSAWDRTGYWPLPERGIFRSNLFIDSWGIHKSVATVSIAFHLTLAVLLAIHGAWRQWRVVRPELRVLYPPH
jgi:hypothetical protein